MDHVEIPGSQYGECIIIDDYQGQISLVLGNVGKDGKVFKKWCFPEYKKEPREKSVPWKIALGNMEEAERTLKALLLMLTAGEVSMPKQSGIPRSRVTPDDSDSTPF